MLATEALAADEELKTVDEISGLFASGALQITINGAADQ